MRTTKPGIRLFGEKIIPAVRGLDLSNRPWENSYNPPAGPDDPVEDHPYEFQRDGGRRSGIQHDDASSGRAARLRVRRPRTP